MPISIVCKHCEKNLKVAVEAAGKKIRCPACKGVITVADPTADEDGDGAYGMEETRAAAPSEEKAAPADQTEGDGDENYGVDEKREAEDEELRRERKREQKRIDDEARKRRRRAIKPHRGNTILLLGILSIVFSCAFVVCWFLGWRAMSMANEDLYEMSSGRMDPAGESTTKTGKLCGIIGFILGLVVLIVAVGISIASR